MIAAPFPVSDPGGSPLPIAPGGQRVRSDLVAAMDVGGTSIKAGLVAADGTVVREARRPTGAEGGVPAVIDRILGFAADLVAGEQVKAIGIGVPGIVDSAAGIARYAANLGWRDVPIVQLLTERVGLPVVLGHDVRLGALAEARVGAGVGAASMYFIAIGTGIAGGQVTGGAVDNGATGQAGEVGHLVVRPGGRLCNCGNHGCLETVSSASRIGQSYSLLRGTDASSTSAREVAELMQAGDPIAIQVWDDAIAALADALAAVTVLTDPGRIVLGGGLSLAGELLTDPLAEALASRMTFRSPPPIAVTQLGDRAGLAGAAILAWDHLRHQPSTLGESMSAVAAGEGGTADD
ncbi:ROK family protein [Nakamurella aerolata]|uniref:ROK family protein n=1 Tax=Nakamurella aerolata TaxID=1656892 RepID=A0A849A9X6_9ACTN|nr:ROK family protein [Nakamurella aerolata]NNG35908.1 ROK family protein [Nakamurella aerolata]